MERRDFLLIAAGATAFAAGRGLSAGDAGSSSKKPKIRVGQIGTAHGHAAGKMAALRSLSEEFEVVGVVEPDAARREAARRRSEYRDVPWMTEEQLLNAPGLQAVAVETGVAELVPTARRCVEAGLHVHLDKPAGESLADFAALLDAAGAERRVVQMGYMFRYNPAFEFCFDAVRNGWLGTVLEVHGVMGKKVGDGERRELAAFAGGGMFELGCHLIDAVVTLLGPPAKVTPYTRWTRDDAGDDLADNQLAVLEYPDAVATVRTLLNEPHGGPRRQFVVVGEAGTVEIRPLEPPKLSLALEKPREGFRAGYQEVPLPKVGGRYDGDFLDLAAIIRGEEEPSWTAAHDLAVQTAVLNASGIPAERR